MKPSHADHRSVLAKPFTLLWLFAVAQTLMFVTYLLFGATPSEYLLMVVSFAWAILFAWWIVADARIHGRVPCFDFGFFVYLLLPWSVVWYCVWSRGWRGLLLLVALAGLLFVPYVIVNVVAMLMM